MPKNRSKTTLERAVDIGLRDREIFDWPNVEGAFDKFKEEVTELSEVISTDNKAKVYEEFSDVFFTLLQVARHLKISPEKNLEFSLQKYDLRYKKMFELAKNSQSKNVDDMSVDELEVFWQKAKKETDAQLQDLLASYLTGEFSD